MGTPYVKYGRDLELLEPYEGKLSSTVLRGEGGSNTADLLDRPSDVGRALRTVSLKYEK